MFYQTKDKSSAVITCLCECNNGLIFRKDVDTGDVWISMVENNYYTYQQTFWKRFKTKCKHFWSILRNKEYTYFEVGLEEKDIVAFQDFVNSL